MEVSTENVSKHETYQFKESENTQEISSDVPQAFASVEVKSEEETADIGEGLFATVQVKSEGVPFYDYDDDSFECKDNKIYIGDFLELNTQASDDSNETIQYDIQSIEASVDNAITFEITEVVNGEVQHFRYKVRPVSNAKEPASASAIYEDDETYYSTPAIVTPTHCQAKTQSKKCNLSSTSRNLNKNDKRVPETSKRSFSPSKEKSDLLDVIPCNNNLLRDTCDIAPPQQSQLTSPPQIVDDTNYQNSNQSKLQEHLPMPAKLEETHNNSKCDIRSNNNNNNNNSNKKKKLILKTTKHIKNCTLVASKSTTRKESLDSHTAFKKEKKLHICNICSRSFTRKSSLNKHSITHNPFREKPFTCNICGKGISCLSYLKTHQASHTNPFKCDICGKNFKFKSYLSVHMRHHFNDRPYMCDLCGKSFTAGTCLQKHRRIHTGISPYQCSICEKYFAQKVCLDIHMANHTGIKPYLCHVCGKSFPLSSYLGKHIRTEHQAVDSHLQPTTKKLQTHKRVIKCKICKMSFKDKLFLQYHIQEYHNS